MNLPFPYSALVPQQKKGFPIWGYFAIGAGAYVVYKFYGEYKKTALTNQGGSGPAGQLTLSDRLALAAGQTIKTAANELIFPVRKIGEFVNDAVIPGDDSLGTLIHRIFNPEVNPVNKPAIWSGNPVQ